MNARGIVTPAAIYRKLRRSILTTRRGLMKHAAILLGTFCLAGVAGAGDTDWPGYGGDAAKTRHSALTQINRDNVRKLALAWQYDTAEKGDTQTQPIVVGRKLFGYTPSHKTFALDAVTGKRLWVFDSGIAGVGANRGLMYWTDGKDARVFAAVDNFVYALDIATGKPVAEFGGNGRIDLRENLGRDPASQSVHLTSPGVIYRELLILGGRVSESLPASPGHVRAYDVRTGALRWSFHTIPQPGEPGYDTWPKDAWKYIGGANSWPGMTLDTKRGLVFVPTGSAAADFYGGNRLGDNLYANCLLALDAATGKLRWHFQFVKHDVLDRDLPTAPTLVTLRLNGRRVDALVQTTKQGFVFVLDRDTGKPVFPVEEIPAPATDVPGETTNPTYLRPKLPAPYARQRLAPELLTTRTPEAAKWAREQFAQLRSDGPFKPLGVGVETTIYPGFDGGAEWGGPAYDPDSGVLYVNANEMAWLGSLAFNDTGRSTGKSIYLRDCAACHGDNMQGSPPQFPSLAGLAKRMTPTEFTALVRKGGGRMPAFANMQGEAIAAVAKFLFEGEDIPAGIPDHSPGNQIYRFTGYRRWLDPQGYPAVGMPWGTLNAIELATGKYLWRIPFGDFPELAASGLKNTGSENYGGPLVTSGGLLFIGATIHDRKFRAFDKRNGKLLWDASMPYSADATPITYQIDGRQYVAIFASGGKERGGSQGGVYLSYALPKQ
jgi:quinoprotein glucose dehydrogenase